MTQILTIYKSRVEPNGVCVNLRSATAAGINLLCIFSRPTPIYNLERFFGSSSAPDFSGETPIFMGTANIVSVRAVTAVRAARF